jgi:cob(I)alamin adenosyltransferase
LRGFPLGDLLEKSCSIYLTPWGREGFGVEYFVIGSDQQRNYTAKGSIFPHSGYNSNMSPIYTRTGDDGSTGLLGEVRLPKHHPRIEALGALDEASAALGLARAICQTGHTKAILMDAQRDLYAMMAEIAATPENAEHFQLLAPARVQWLESQIDHLSTKVPPTKEFILPGDSVSGAILSLSRAIVRQAERRVADLLDRGEIHNPVLLHYLNRLSSLCFTLELMENKLAGQEPTMAKK